MQPVFDSDVTDYIRGINAQGRGLIPDVHPDDEMYLFFTTHPDHLKTPLKSYFISGDGMLQNPFRRLHPTPGLSLEFAAGGVR